VIKINGQPFHAGITHRGHQMNTVPGPDLLYERCFCFCPCAKETDSIIGL